MNPKNYQLFLDGNSIRFITHREQIGNYIDENVPQKITAYVSERWENEYKPAEAEFLAMNKKDDVKAWLTKSRSLQDIELSIKSGI